jgi:protein-histidine pros-kinase
MLSPLESAEGTLVTAAIRDISVRKAAETHLAQMEGRYRGLLEAAPDAMVVVNQSGEIVLLNLQAEKQFGYRRDELVGQIVKAIIPEGFAERLLADGQRSKEEALGQQIGAGIELIGRRKDGGEFPIEIMLSPLESAEGTLVTAAIRDISLRKAIEEALLEEKESAQLARAQAEEANRAKSRFLAGMSHELRTPLNGILGYARLLRLEGSLDVTQATRVDAMLAAGTHLLQMINCVLDLSEIEVGHIELQTAEVELRDAASTCLEFVRPAAEAKKLVLELLMQPDVPHLIAIDPTRLRQILLNLLGNAVKFTTQGSVILRLLLTAERAKLRFEVADTGPGISIEDQASLFQEFRRLDTRSTGTGVEGAGLGLAIAARLTALMGGQLGHEDNPVGGSMFWLELPLVEHPTAALLPAAEFAPEVPHGQRGSVPGRALRLLVVDDIAMNRDIAGAFLVAAGHEVAYAEGGLEAVAMVAAADFDLVLMDVRMPDIDGLEATRRIRCLDGVRRQVPIVALTAQAFTEQVRECRKAGMDDHVTKPFTPEMLRDAVARGIEAGRLRGEVKTTPPGADAIRGELGGPASVPIAVPEGPARSPAVPVLDLAAFERTAAFLAPDMVARHLQSIAERGEALQRGLRALGAATRAGNELSAAAHALGGSAGMFGFESLAAAARGFEHAVQTDAEDAPILAHTLDAALEAALQIISSRTPVSANV